MTDFNPDDLMHTSMDKKSSTAIIPVPLGDWEGTLGKPTFRQAVIKKGERTGEVMTFMDIMISFEDNPEVVAECKRPKPSIRHSVILTLTEDGKGISEEEGENVDLGRLREACGLNEPGDDFSPAMLEGQRVVVATKHVPDDTDPETIYANVIALRRPE